ncbi:MAG TPA: hypothetical protein VKW09_03515 [bacterium]|nr:hypothetical protein [bacterium]
MKPEHGTVGAPPGRVEAASPREGPDVDLEHRPEAVLSVLEADQLVAAKERAHLGRMRLSGGVRVLLGGLRLYVVAMMIIVLVQVLNAVHGGH